MAGGRLGGMRGGCGEWLEGRGAVSFIFMHRLQVPVGLHQVLQRDPFTDREICYLWYSMRGTHLVMGRGTSLATTEDHCSESWAFLGTGMDQRPDGRSLLSAAPRSEIEVDERWISK